MASSRRQFIARTALGLAAVASGDRRALADGKVDAKAAPAATSPPAFGTAPPVGPEVSAATFAEAEKLMQVKLTPAERALAASNWRQSMAPMLERRTGPRKVPLDGAPATRWQPSSLLGPTAAGATPKVTKDRFVRSHTATPALPLADEDIAFAPLTSLSRWLETRRLTSERLTRIYLERLERYQSRLLCSITILRDEALAEARRADSELERGHYRGPLHGVPWGAKDLVDTAGVATTYGAEPFRTRVPGEDATVVRRLRDAGAVLVAKLSLGALALNDVWFGGQTKNPWLLEEGASGSSAGPGAAVAAGLVGFALGSETLGSIVSPSTRCGVAGLRPTFGRVPRTGALTLSWSLDKLGPMARTVEDTLLVLRVLSGPDAGDPSSVPSRLDFDATAPVRGLRVGYVPAWMNEAPATEVDRQALDLLRGLGIKLVEVKLPDWPYASLQTILMGEVGASFEELALGHGLDALKMQVADAWPNSVRQARFLSAIDFVQADRLRRRVAVEMARLMTEADVLIVPSLRDEMLTISNFTGHPSLTLRTGFISVDKARSDWAPDPARPLPTFAPPRRVPHGPTLVGRLFDEGLLGRVGLALETAAGVAKERPPAFA